MLQILSTQLPYFTQQTTPHQANRDRRITQIQPTGAQPNGARRGTRTHDLLILTYYRFHGPFETSQRVWGLDFLFTIFKQGQPLQKDKNLSKIKVGGVKSLHSLQQQLLNFTKQPLFPIARDCQFVSHQQTETTPTKVSPF